MERNLELFPKRRIYRVSELVEEMRVLVEERFVDVFVQGEISNFVSHSSGHMYFSLKDAQGQLRCAFFRMQNRQLRFTPKNGLEVVAHGRISLYAAKGDIQLIVESMEPRGLGSLQYAFEQLKTKLQAEGLFDAARKRALPLLPQKIGIITSATGAAIQDILRVLGRRNQRVQVLIYNARVQGEGAGVEIVQGLRHLNLRDDLDVLVVTRGGGSLEDLWPFNEEIVARAIYESRLPVISAVGHEIDYTIADFVADVRAATPSQAAEIVAGATEELCRRAETLSKRAYHQVCRILEQKRSALERLSRNRAFIDAENKFRQIQQRLDEVDLRLRSASMRYAAGRRQVLEVLQDRLLRIDLVAWVALRGQHLERLTAQSQAAVGQVLARRRQQFTLRTTALDAISPLRVLDRGYAIVRDAQSRIVKSARQVQPDDWVQVKLAQGKIDCQVRKTED
ncbi:MAG: exodeoxyribonuclease VII large subunit [Acidobacteriota bacterium]